MISIEVDELETKHALEKRFKEVESAQDFKKTWGNSRTGFFLAKP